MLRAPLPYGAMSFSQGSWLELCCRVTVVPAPPADLLESLLKIGLFRLAGGQWVRYLPDTESVAIKHNIAAGTIEMSISPTVGRYEQHAERRVAASVMFEMAAKIAERVEGEIWHIANVIGCRRSDGMTSPLAVYPDHPLLYENLCPGFREVFVA